MKIGKRQRFHPLVLTKNRHNFEGNPEQFKVVAEIISVVLQRYYGELQCRIVNILLKQRFAQENELIKLLSDKKATDIQLALKELASDQLLKQYVSVRASLTVYRTSKGENRAVYTYELDLESFLDIIQYRNFKMFAALKAKTKQEMVSIEFETELKDITDRLERVKRLSRAKREQVMSLQHLLTILG